MDFMQTNIHLILFDILSSLVKTALPDSTDIL